MEESNLDSSKIPLLDKIFTLLKITDSLNKIKAQVYLDVISKQFQVEKDIRQNLLN